MNNVTVKDGRTLVILEEKPSTASYLKVVLAKWGSEYVTWIYNESFNGFSNGHYYTDLLSAVNDYSARE